MHVEHHLLIREINTRFTLLFIYHLPDMNLIITILFLYAEHTHSISVSQNFWNSGNSRINYYHKHTHTHARANNLDTKGPSIYITRAPKICILLYYNPQNPLKIRRNNNISTILAPIIICVFALPNRQQNWTD